MPARMILLSHMHLRMVYQLAGETPPPYLNGPRGLPCEPIMERLGNIRRFSEDDYQEKLTALGYGETGDLGMIRYQEAVPVGWIASMISKGFSRKRGGPYLSKLVQPLILPSVEEITQPSEENFVDPARELEESYFDRRCEEDLPDDLFPQELYGGWQVEDD
jgi:hypothetical protein